MTCIATDEGGNQSSCEFTVDVVDTTPPELIVPSDVLTIECDQMNGGTVQYPPAMAMDICDPAPDVVCDPEPGAVLPIGTHPVTCTATDDSGNMSTKTFNIVIVDTAPPSLTCVQDITLEYTGPDGAVVEYPEPTVTDVCDPAPNLACLPASGSVFPIGVTTVTCTADDQDGNMVRCIFLITVEDTTPPVLDCPSAIVTMCTSPMGTPVSYTVTATDLCDPQASVSCTPPSGSLFPIGSSTVTCTAMDNVGNQITCEFTVTVRDETPPTIVCTQDFEQECTAPTGVAIEYPLASAFDDCDPNVQVVCDPAPAPSLLWVRT